MTNSSPKITIGLFGTCANSTWRDKFIKTYQKLNIDYYNPQVSDWKPTNATIEANHLATDDIILFPVLSRSYGLGSLAETGYSILNAIKLDSQRQFVILIDDDVDEKLYLNNHEMAKISKNTRAIIQQHLSQLKLDNLYIVQSLDDMLELSIGLQDIVSKKKLLKLKFAK